MQITILEKKKAIGLDLITVYTVNNKGVATISKEKVAILIKVCL